MASKESKNKISVVLAWIGLIVITIMLIILAYGMISHDGKLILSMIIGLVFVSILFWIGIKIAKDQKQYEEAITRKEREKEMYDLTHKKTRSI